MKRAKAIKKHETCYGTRLISFKNTDFVRRTPGNNHLTRLTLCIKRAGYSKRYVCFPWLTVSKNYPQTSGAFRDFFVFAVDGV